jgi:hypothetical protein
LIRGALGIRPLHRNVVGFAVSHSNGHRSGDDPFKDPAVSWCSSVRSRIFAKVSAAPDRGKNAKLGHGFRDRVRRCDDVGLFHEADLSHRLRPVLRFYRPLVVRAGLQALNQPGRFQAMCDHVPRVGFCPENRIALGQAAPFKFDPRVVDGLLDGLRSVDGARWKGGDGFGANGTSGSRRPVFGLLRISP